MTTELLAAADLAQILQMTEDQVRRRTRADDWPHVRIGHKTIRYRAEHVEQILALYERQPATTAARGLPGQTQRSRRRAS